MEQTKTSFFRLKWRKSKGLYDYYSPSVAKGHRCLIEHTKCYDDPNEIKEIMDVVENELLIIHYSAYTNSNTWGMDKEVLSYSDLIKLCEDSK